MNPASPRELRPRTDSYTARTMEAHLLDTHRIDHGLGRLSREIPEEAELLDQHRLEHLAASPLGAGRGFTHNHEGGIPLAIDLGDLLLGSFVLHAPRAEGSHMALCAGAEHHHALGELEPTARGWHADSKGICSRCISDLEARGLALVIVRQGAEVRPARGQVIGTGR